MIKKLTELKKLKKLKELRSYDIEKGVKGGSLTPFMFVAV